MHTLGEIYTAFSVSFMSVRGHPSRGLATLYRNRTEKKKNPTVTMATAPKQSSGCRWLTGYRRRPQTSVVSQIKLIFEI